ncbi:MAG: protein kinase, partial [Bryobacterales bacterium]|nr:protein kinase [Bryobacterales bacterium]
SEDQGVTRAGYLIGSPHYMAPEQLLGESGSQLSDVYSFGVLLYELFSGRKPFEGSEMHALMYSIVNDQLDYEPLRVSGIPEGLQTLIGSCMARSSSDRIPHFGAIVSEIERIIDLNHNDRPTQYHSTPYARQGSALRRSWWVAVLLVTAAIATVSLFHFALAPTESSSSGLLFGPRTWLVAAAVGLALVWYLVRLRQQALGRRSDETDHSLRPRNGYPSSATVPVSREPAGSKSLDRSYSGTPRADGSVFGQAAARGDPVVGDVPDAASFPSRTHHGPPPGKPSAPSTQSAIEDEFTRVFRTAPSSHGGLPSNAPASPISVSDKHRGGGSAESTQLFRIPSSKNSDAWSDPSVAPPVALFVSNCTHTGWIGKRLTVHGFPCRIGRSGDADVDLSFDTAVTRHHATIHFEDEGFTIYDLGSANGTFVNGRRLPPNMPQPLLFGARILLGSNTELTFALDELTEIPDLTGTTIGNRYRLTEKLTEGAQSAVYRAQDATLPRQVLVKILSARLVGFSGYKEHFEREAQIASELNHPHINRVLDFGEVEYGAGANSASVYICMEYLDGGSFAKRVASDPMLNADRIATWLERVASALSHVHAAGIVHGGIRPSAIIFDRNDNPYLTDFAFAVDIGSVASGTAVGAPGFLAPEQWESAEITSATDQYSLAVLTYYALTGVLPYEGQEHPRIRKRNLMLAPPPAHEIAEQNGKPKVPPAVSAVVERALSRDPKLRYPTICDFADAFAEAILVGARKPNEPLRVFVSYQRAASSPWALYFKKELEREHGFSVFVDSEQRDNAGQFPKRIEECIARCDIFVCILAQKTLESAWVQREIELAHNGRKPIVPVFQESFRMPRDLNVLPIHVRELLQFGGVKLFDRQNSYVDAAVTLLANTIRQFKHED